MNIGGLVAGLKKKARERETIMVKREANKLQSLKDERIRVEGQKKIYDIRDKEKAKLMKAKKELRDKRLGGLLKVADNIKKNKKKGKKKDIPSFLPDSSNLFK